MDRPPYTVRYIVTLADGTERSGAWEYAAHFQLAGVTPELFRRLQLSNRDVRRYTVTVESPTEPS